MSKLILNYKVWCSKTNTKTIPVRQKLLRLKQKVNSTKTSLVLIKQRYRIHINFMDIEFKMDKSFILS